LTNISAKEVMMKAIVLNKIKIPGLFSFSLLITLFFVCQSPAYGALGTPKTGPSHESLMRKEMPKILPVLEERIGNKRLIERSKEKLYSMGDREIRLISALCERIPTEESSVSGDIAFFLVTALIIVS
jgi:hypothetical protein